MEYLVEYKEIKPKSDTNYYSYNTKKWVQQQIRRAYKNFNKKKPKNKKQTRRRKKRKYKNRVPRKYSIYIKSVYWEKRKNQYWQKYSKRCCVCGSCERVQLHHGKYDNNYFGREPDEWMFPLCQDHHTEFHETHKTCANMLDKTMKFITDNYIPHESTDV
jgi:hypothetical protein